MSSNLDQSDLPNLPGFRINVDLREKFHKTHLFDMCNGIPVTDIKRTKIELTPEELKNKIIQQSINGNNNDKINDKTQNLTNNTQNLPSWVVNSRKVLRWYAYIKDDVENSGIEKLRIRKLVIYYYLEDNTFAIYEQRSDNSTTGIPAGPYLKRQKIPFRNTNENNNNNNNNNPWLNAKNVLIGSTINVYGKNFYVTDADIATRNHFKNEFNIELKEKIEIPKDDYHKFQEQMQYYKQMSKDGDDIDIRGFVEATLGGTSSSELAKQRKYLANDRKVLRFYAVWDDSSLYGNKIYYILHYFLADDTIEVKLDAIKNKDDNNALLLNRGKLPKKYEPKGVVFGKNNKIKYYNHSDLRIGCYINLYGRQLLLIKADPFTINFYKQQYNLNNKDFNEIKQLEIKKKEIKLEPPPYTGYGTEEDSLGSWKSLVPKQPKKDHGKFIKYDGCSLRFLGKFIIDINDKDNNVNSNIDNIERRFVIEFFPADDTVKIFEKPIRNSGFLSGTFLERCKIKNINNGHYFHAEDFYNGAKLNINGFKFELIQCDSQTKQFMDNNWEIFTRDNIQTILKGLADKLWDRSFNQTSTFRLIDTSQDGKIDPDELKKICKIYGWNLNPNQLNAMFKYFDTDNSGSISADEFFKALQTAKLSK